MKDAFLLARIDDERDSTAADLITDLTVALESLLYPDLADKSCDPKAVNERALQWINSNMMDGQRVPVPYATGEVFLRPQDAAVYRDSMNEAHKEHLGKSKYIALSGKLYEGKADIAQAFAVLPAQLVLTVYTVLVNDGMEHVTGTFVSRERALEFAGEELERMTRNNAVLKFEDDDAELFCENVVFSQSCTVRLPQGTQDTVFGVIVQSMELDDC